MKTRSFFLSCALIACLLGCSSQDGDSLAAANRAYAHGNYLEAQELYQSYIQTESGGTERWRAWSRLLSICLDIRSQPQKALPIVDTMLLEFASSPQRVAELSWKRAEILTQVQDNKAAIEAWQKILDDPAFSRAQQWQAVQELYSIFQRQQRYALMRDVLAQNSDLAPSTEDKLRVQYKLAQVYFLLRNFKEASHSLDALLAQENIPAALEVQAVYLLAEIALEQGKVADARKLFFSLKGRYPNPQALRIRIDALAE